MIWKQRDIKPERSEVVEGWLDAMFGEALPDVVEWLHLAVDTERPCPVLYLYGLPGTGKGLLGRGLAHVWNPGEPSDLVDFFNLSKPLTNPICLEDVPAESDLIDVGHDGHTTRPGIGARLVIVHSVPRPPVLPNHWLAVNVREEARQLLVDLFLERSGPLVAGDEIAAHVLWLVSEPRPCPFCRAVPPVVWVHERPWRVLPSESPGTIGYLHGARVRCERCGASGPVAEGASAEEAREVALAGWNRGYRYRISAS